MVVAGASVVTGWDAVVECYPVVWLWEWRAIGNNQLFYCFFVDMFEQTDVCR